MVHSIHDPLVTVYVQKKDCLFENYQVYNGLFLFNKSYLCFYIRFRSTIEFFLYVIRLLAISYINIYTIKLYIKYIMISKIIIKKIEIEPLFQEINFLFISLA